MRLKLPVESRSAGFQTCCIADFQVGMGLKCPRAAGLETGDTADLEVCATVRFDRQLQSHPRRSVIDAAELHCKDSNMTLTLELSDLRESNKKALTELSRAPAERFDGDLAEIENFLLSVYRFAVLAVRNEKEIERAAAAWRETLEVIDSAARQVRTLATKRGIRDAHPSLDRILGIRSAASHMLALYE